MRNSFYLATASIGSRKDRPGRFHGGRSASIRLVANGQDDRRDDYRVGHSRWLKPSQMRDAQFGSPMFPDISSVDSFYKCINVYVIGFEELNRP
nr:hypothetical protein SFGR64A_00026 [Sinorhizobium fredii GR64]